MSNPVSTGRWVVLCDGPMWKMASLFFNALRESMPSGDGLSQLAMTPEFDPGADFDSDFDCDESRAASGACPPGVFSAQPAVGVNAHRLADHTDLPVNPGQPIADGRKCVR